MKNIKLTYIGGGSKMWARVFMTDLALANDLGGEIALYDIDVESAYINKRIGERINLDEKAKSKFNYEVYENIDDALKGADFVVISILPGTFEEMRVDVHLPQKYGINQSVGDTCLRKMARLSTCLNTFSANVNGKTLLRLHLARN